MNLAHIRRYHQTRMKYVAIGAWMAVSQAFVPSITSKNTIPMMRLGTDVTETIASNETSATISNGMNDDTVSTLKPSFHCPSSTVLAINPNVVEVKKIDTPTEIKVGPSEDVIKRLPFVNMFRGSANYIARHRNTVAVYHIPGGLIEASGDVFADLMNDIALTWLLGMKVVLVVGCREQVQKRLKCSYEYGLKVTDEKILRIVKEEAGYVRFEVERQLARSLRMQGSGTRAGGRYSKGYYVGNVVSGNFYSAQPHGILDGVDYKYAGFVRRIEVDNIRKLHEQKDICLLSTLGVSPSGEVFNVNSEALAASAAGALGASKVIFFTEQEMELRNKEHDKKIQSLRLSDARNVLNYYGVKINTKGYVEEPGERLDVYAQGMLLKIGWSVEALERGVKRAHIISPRQGALLQELFTRDGSGTLVSGDLYDGIRRADVGDVSGIHDLISPLIEMGTLIDRPKATLENDIDSYYVFTRDDHIVACGQLKIFDQGFAEIGCLVVNPSYRSRGRGDAMLGYLERLSLLNGCSSIFVLSTQTMEWFIERDFEEVNVGCLPESRQRTYNYERNSKIYMKQVESDRDLDASELLWDR